ncbi:flavodoxin domain-containing protein [Hutsoniella sourekii]
MLHVIYGSNYGHAREYAEAFAQALNLSAVAYSQIGKLKGEDSIVYFGALYAGGVKGLKTIKGNFDNFVLVTVGLADPKDSANTDHIKQSIKKSMNEYNYDRAKIFHLRGGIDYRELKLHHKLMMALVYYKAKNIPKEQQSEETKTMIETYGSQVDFVDFKTLDPIIGYIKKAGWLETIKNDKVLNP